MPKCIELLPYDWLIRNLCYQAIEQMYLIKWPVSVCGAAVFLTCSQRNVVDLLAVVSIGTFSAAAEAV